MMTLIYVSTGRFKYHPFRELNRNEKEENAKIIVFHSKQNQNGTTTNDLAD